MTMSDKEFFRESMQLVTQRALDLAIQRIYAHREFEKPPRKEEKAPDEKKEKRDEPL